MNEPDLKIQAEYELYRNVMLTSTEDFKEGVQSFLEKGSPFFRADRAVTSGLNGGFDVDTGIKDGMMCTNNLGMNLISIIKIAQKRESLSMNQFEEMVTLLNRRIKKIEENPDPTLLKSTKMLYCASSAFIIRVETNI